jgi:hypothetical protein
MINNFKNKTVHKNQILFLNVRDQLPNFPTWLCSFYVKEKIKSLKVANENQTHNKKVIKNTSHPLRT